MFGMVYPPLAVQMLGLIYTHLATGTEHYDFECIPVGSSITGRNYHTGTAPSSHISNGNVPHLFVLTLISSSLRAGMCECTSTKTLNLELDTSGFCPNAPGQACPCRCADNTRTFDASAVWTFPKTCKTHTSFKPRAVSLTRHSSGTKEARWRHSGGRLLWAILG